MPELDGFQTAKLIKESQIAKKPFIIGYSSYNTSSIIRKCYESGMDDYLVKPATRKQLIKKIQE
jgi:CheY-like chemotaxis protein